MASTCRSKSSNAFVIKTIFSSAGPAITIMFSLIIVCVSVRVLAKSSACPMEAAFALFICVVMSANKPSHVSLVLAVPSTTATAACVHPSVHPAPIVICPVAAKFPFEITLNVL